MIVKKEWIAMLLAGGQGSRLYALTRDIAKPAVPFGGKYRIIDFPLSNCVNSGIDTVGVLTQYQPLQLNEYLGNGQPWDLDRIHGGVYVLPPYQNSSGSDWYSGTANAIYQNIGFLDLYDPEYVVLIALDTPNPATGTYISGGVMAAPTVARVMEDILPYLGVEPDYSEVDMSRVTVRMPNLAGKTESEAAAILEEDHLNYKIIGDGDKIASQIPAHGRELPGNSTVLLYTDDSMPTDEVEVPNLTGMTVAQASTTLSQLGLYLQAKGTDSNAWYVVVTKQDIDAGTKVPRCTMIAVTFTDTTALD